MASELLTSLVEPANLWAAWEHVRAKRGGAGLDGVFVGQIATRPEELLERLADELAGGRYRPWPYRRAWIPKSDGSSRPIGIGTVRDRIAQRAALHVLIPRCEPRFNPTSFAYRPGLGLADAVHSVESWRDAGHQAVLEADITACFDSLDHELLESILDTVVPEADVRRLLTRWLHAGVVEQGRTVVPEQGVVQGDILSPLFCNLYLDNLDDGFGESAGLVRYADDFIVLARTTRGAQRAHLRAAELLDSLRLELNPAKTRLADFDHGFVFLGVEFVHGLALPLKQRYVLGRDGRTRAVAEPCYELDPPPVSRPPRPVNKRLERALNAAVALEHRTGRPAPAMVEAFRRALADKGADVGAWLLGDGDETDR